MELGGLGGQGASAHPQFVHHVSYGFHLCCDFLGRKEGVKRVVRSVGP